VACAERLKNTCTRPTCIHVVLLLLIPLLLLPLLPSSLHLSSSSSSSPRPHHRHRGHDFIYESELQGAVEGGALSKLHVAFSRMGAKKDYVQHHMEAQAGESVCVLEHRVESTHSHVCVWGGACRAVCVRCLCVLGVRCASTASA
jgi:hypothetical protein